MSSRRLVPIVAICAVLGAGGVHAQVQRPPAEAPNAVSPVLILPPTSPPRLVATYPAQDQAVAPGVLILKATFDQQMSPAAWNYAPAAGAEPMDCVRTPRLLADQKTFVLLCRVLADRTYGVTFNAQRPGGFANLGDNPAQTASLTFKVESGTPITTVRRAMEAAGLQSDQMPVQDAPMATAGVNAAAASAAAAGGR
ncbi:hypothetical protein [Caulobacter sp.]|uniref:hypothetical protein n=1 Tax=Caulobacter sp. TaxID=78 RepID=UPI002B47DBC6|nr:hypothetical protein [Caulobacter sp.]HJV43458.1 hypothetical protein [Caulobacter sp.]